MGFSYAFFYEGFTGLAVTIGAIITLFILMQVTARINWSEVFAAKIRRAVDAAVAPRTRLKPQLPEDLPSTGPPEDNPG